jgi:hypothetical protein
MSTAAVRRWMPRAILLGAILIYFYRLLLGEVIFWGVPLLQFYPWQKMAFDSLRSGALPLWNPLLGNGAPLLANYQTAVFYPPNWLHLIVPSEYAMGLIGLAHVAWAGLGMMAYLKRLGVSGFGQGVGALGFALSGYLLGRFGFLSITATVPWIPWAFWAVEGVLDAGSDTPMNRQFILLAVVVAMMLLAGHAQTSAYCFALLGPYAIWRLAGTSREEGQWAGRAGLLVGALALGVAAAGVQLIPTLELAINSQRAGGLEQEFAFTYSFSPARFLTLFMPNLFGSPAAGGFWGYGAYWEDAIYVGFLPAVLAARSVFEWVRERRAGAELGLLRVVPFYGASLPPVFVLALGRHTPVFPWLYAHVPGSRLFQAPTRWSILAVFGLCVLAAVGADRWRTGARRLNGARRAMVVGLGLGVSGIASRIMLAGVEIEGSLIRAVLRLGVSLLLVGLAALLLERVEERPEWRPRWEAGILALVALDLLTAHWGLVPTIDARLYHEPSALAAAIEDELGGHRVFYLPEDVVEATNETFLNADNFQSGDRATWAALRGSLLPNVNVIDGVPGANNFEPLRVGAYDALMESIEGAGWEEALPLLQGMDVGVLLSPSPRAGLDVIARQGPLYAYHVPDPWGRAALADCARVGAAYRCERRLEGEAVLLEEEPTRLAIQTDSERPGYLLLADTYYPGWGAEVDGSPAAIWQANGAFRAVEVPAGAHEVVFAYRPLSLTIGAGISGGAFIILTIIAIWRPGRRAAAA